MWTPVLLAVMTATLLLAVSLARRRHPARAASAASGQLVLLLCASPAVALAQLLPWPIAWLQHLSPRAAQVRLAVEPAVRFAPVSLDVPATLFETARSLTLIAVVLLFGRLGRDRDACRWIFRGLVAIGLIQAVVDGIHRLTNNHTSILHLYQFPPAWYAGLGTFVNHNHAANLLVLTCAVTAGLLVDSQRRRWIWGAALALQVLTLLFSGSRGGLFAAAAAGAVAYLLSAGDRLGQGRALAYGLVVALLGLLAAWLCVPEFAARMHSVWDGSITRYEKVRVWRDTLPMMRDFWLLGAGKGAFSSAFPLYRTGDEDVSVPYAASLPLQQLCELGVPATVAIWLLALRLCRGLWLRRRWLTAAERYALAGVCGVMVHNLVDFGLELPGVAVPTLLCLAPLCARARSRGGPAPPSAGIGLRLFCLAGALGVFAARWAVVHSLADEKADLRGAILSDDFALAGRLFPAIQRRHPADFNVELLGATTALSQSDREARSAAVGDREARSAAVIDAALALHRANRVLQLHPADGQAHRIVCRILARSHRLTQAGLEARLAFEHGWAHDENSLAEVSALVGPALIDAVAQNPDRLRYIARMFQMKGRPADAARAAYRAAVLAPDQNPAQK